MTIWNWTPGLGDNVGMKPLLKPPPSSGWHGLPKLDWTTEWFWTTSRYHTDHPPAGKIGQSR